MSHSQLKISCGMVVRCKCNSFCYFELVHYKKVTKLWFLKDFWTNGNSEAALCVFIISPLGHCESSTDLVCEDLSPETLTCYPSRKQLHFK